jgi:sulfur relay (sulfurtransferase) DsrC/TusE family protein
MSYEIKIEKDWDGYLAKVVGYDNLFAWWLTENEAQSELMNVIDMMMDFYMEKTEQQRSIRNFLFTKWFHYAI